eukprot:3242797-Prymnesium_polylepis.2
MIEEIELSASPAATSFGRVPRLGEAEDGELHAGPIQAHTSAPLLVSIEEDEGVIIAHRVACLYF